MGDDGLDAGMQRIVTDVANDNSLVRPRKLLGQFKAELYTITLGVGFIAVMIAVKLWHG